MAGCTGIRVQKAGHVGLTGVCDISIIYVRRLSRSMWVRLDNWSKQSTSFLPWRLR